MNKRRIHNIFSSIQMSSRDKKDLVNVIFNNGGINESTPIKESIDGTELVPIFDGKNKAVNVSELLKGKNSNDTTYIFNFTESQTTVTQDEYDGLKNAIINKNRIIIIMFDQGVTEFIEPPIRGISDESNEIMMMFTRNDCTVIFIINDTLNISIELFIYIDSTYVDEKIITVNNKITALEERIAALEGTTT